MGRKRESKLTPDLIKTLIQAYDIKEWQARMLKGVHSIMFMDANITQSVRMEWSHSVQSI